MNRIGISLISAVALVACGRNPYPKLYFNMSSSDVNLYYSKVDSLIDKNDDDIYITKDKYTAEEFNREKKERSDKTRYFPKDITFERPGDVTYVFTKTAVRPDGYVNYNNSHYRTIANTDYPPYNFQEFQLRSIEPLKSRTGYLIIESDLPVYSMEDNQKKGLLRKGTVFKINSVSLDNKIVEGFSFDLQGYIEAKDIPIIWDLLQRVKYAIEDGKLYRTVDGDKVEIDTPIERNGDGLRYARNDGSDGLTNGFYCWEYFCDFFFDEEGSFVKFGYAPDFGH